MSLRAVDVRTVKVRTQADPRGISRGDVVELEGGTLATAERAKGQTLFVRVVPGADAKSLDKAINRYKAFTGMTPKSVARGERPKPDGVVFIVGHVEGIAYETVRDGKRDRYFHRFKKSARPHLAVSPDGQRLEILGGGFRFTDRGIVDA